MAADFKLPVFGQICLRLVPEPGSDSDHQLQSSCEKPALSSPLGEEAVLGRVLGSQSRKAKLSLLLYSYAQPPACAKAQFVLTSGLSHVRRGMYGQGLCRCLWDLPSTHRCSAHSFSFSYSSKLHTGLSLAPVCPYFSHHTFIYTWCLHTSGTSAGRLCFAVTSLLAMYYTKHTCSSSMQPYCGSCLCTHTHANQCKLPTRMCFHALGQTCNVLCNPLCTCSSHPA